MGHKTSLHPQGLLHPICSNCKPHSLAGLPNDGGPPSLTLNSLNLVRYLYRERHFVSKPQCDLLGSVPVCIIWPFYADLHGESDDIICLPRFYSVWVFYLAVFGSLVSLGLLYWKRHNFPTNFIFLTVFTLMEAFTVGVVVAFYETTIVLQALLITVGVFLGLTLFTFQSKVCLLRFMPPSPHGN
jgi:hypothetical protein